LKPEFIFFTEQGGTRGAVAIIDVNNPSEIPSFSEPFFLILTLFVNSEGVMSPEDLGRAGLEDLGRKSVERCLCNLLSWRHTRFLKNTPKLRPRLQRNTSLFDIPCSILDILFYFSPDR
jgi:hypothetical protein